MFAAVLDTCVIFSGLRRDLLLSLAAHHSFRLVLTEDILWEIEYVEERKRVSLGDEPAVAADRAGRLAGRMRSAFGVEAEDRVSLVGSVGLPDPDDEHLVAAAVAGGAEVIVTDNTKDLPARLLPDGVRTMTPERFLHDMVCANTSAAVGALESMSERRSNPPQSEADIVDLLLLKGEMWPRTADVLRAELERNRTRFS